MKKRLYTLVFGFLLALTLFTGSALAQSVDDSAFYGDAAIKGQTSTALGSALGQGTEDPRIIAANVIRILLGFLGLFAVGLILYAGWVIMRSQGDSTEIENAKKILKSGVVGLVIVLSAFAIVSFIISSLLSAVFGDNYGGGGDLPGGGNFDDSNSFRVVSTNPMDGDFNVFRNPNVVLLFNRTISDEYSTQDLNAKFTLEKTKQYDGPTTETGSSTTFVATSTNIQLNAATTSNSLELSIRASSTCHYVDPQGATSTIKNCIDAWAEYKLTVSDAILSMAGLSLNCTNKCVIIFTTNASIDLGRPVITSISPQGGFCENDINRACLVDSDCQNSGKCDLKTPNAAVGNLVTIAGDYFGNTPGEVYFGSSTNPAQLASAANSECTDSWSNRQIIAVMPTGLNSSSSVKVIEASANKWEDVSNDTYGPKNRNILLNTITRPGLCKITPTSGVSSATTTYYGTNLTASQAYFGSLLAKLKSATDIFSLTNSGNGFVPNVETGTTTTFALQGKTFSNFLAFHKDVEQYSGPYISGFVATSGRAGTYVTISGKGFGYAAYEKLGKTGTHRIFLSTNPSIVSSSSLFGSAIEASFVFPEICRADLWRDKEITMKIPAGLVLGADYYIYLVFPKDNSTAWLLNSNLIADRSYSKTFKLTDQLTPGLCSLRPPVGQENSLVNAYGEYFPAAGAGGKVKFTFDNDGVGSVFGLPKEGGADKATTSVPDGALSGPVRVFDGVLMSNSKKFTIGTCKKDEECGSATGFCCTSGDGSDGVCRYDVNKSRQKACYNNILSSIYEWSFSTSLATSSLTCSGLTNANACLLANQCPNSPGVCQSGNTNVQAASCTNKTCQEKYPEVCTDTAGNNACVYDTITNLCRHITRSCNTNEDGNGTVTTVLNADDEAVGVLSNKFTGGIRIEDDGGNKVYAATNGQYPLSKQIFPVNTSQAYFQSGRFKAVGELERQVLYYGYAPLDVNQKVISIYQTLRTGNAGVIKAFNDTSITTDVDLVGWNGASIFTYIRSLGFYYDGNTNIAPEMSDIMVQWTGTSTDPKKGAYSTVSGKTINLNLPLTSAIAKKIVLGKTKVMNHYPSGSYMYSSASNVYLGSTANINQWRSFSSLVQGESFDNSALKFRPGTKNVQLMWLLNYTATTAKEKIIFDDIVFSPASCNSVDGKGVYQIDMQGKSCPYGTFAQGGLCTVGSSGSPKTCVVGQVSCNDVSGAKVYQFDPKGQSCPIGTFFDVNNKCTYGSPTSPSGCNACGQGFSCKTGKCVIDYPICEGGTTCTSGKCETGFSCGCCCRVASPKTDCCVGLTCEAGKCVNGSMDYGKCGGCKVESSPGVVNQAASNDACRCKSASRYCKIDPSNPADTGTCEDTAQVNEPCSGSETSSSVTSTSSDTDNATQQAMYWQLDNPGTCPVGSVIDFKNKCTIGAVPLDCATADATSTSIASGYYATCRNAGDTKNYWQIDSQVPCPAGSYLAGNSTLIDGKCTLTSTSMPVACSTAGATSSVILAGNVASCSEYAANYKPNVSYLFSATSTLNIFIDAGNSTSTASCSAGLPSCDPSRNLACDPHSCTCQVKKTEVVTSQVNAGEICKDGASPACTVGVDSCDGDVTTLQCLIDSNPFSVKDCRCCCVPGKTKVVEDINKTNKTLTCLADKGDCSGTSRGLFCGCSNDIECNNGVSGCGADTCCRARPFATSIYPNNGEEGVCRNTIIKMTFNEVMDPTSLSSNMRLVGEYGLEGCPSDTSYFTTIKPKIGWWTRLVAWVSHALDIRYDTAYADTFGNYCAVEGKVIAADGGRSIEFLPKTLLRENTVYYAVILGDSSTTDKYSNGVLSAQGVGVHDDDGTFGSTLPTGNAIKFQTASSSQKFSGRTYFGYNWKFRTKPVTDPAQGVCLFDHAKVQPDGFEDTDYLFKTLKTDSSDNNPALNFDTVPKSETSTSTDNDKVFATHALSDKGKEIVSITGVYQWRWDWSVDNEDVVRIQNGKSGTVGVPMDAQYDLDPALFDDGLDFHATRKLVVTQNKRDAQTYLNAKATIVKDVFSGTEGQSRTSKSLIHVFLCENPWPPVLSWSNWPWTDKETCKGDVACDNNNFQLYYCRDAGKSGTADDLPALGSKSAPILASSTGIMKEYYFLRSGGVSGVSGLGLTGVSLVDGTGAQLSWSKLPTADGYKIYYGLKSGNYPISFDVPKANDTQTLSNLTPGKTYYITMTAYDADRQESKPIPEIVVTVADTAPPAVPLNFHISSTTADSISVTWTKNSDDTVAYKVYYGTMHAIYGKSANVGLLNSYTIKNLATGTLYYMSVAAVDAAGNESSNLVNEISSKPGSLSYKQNALSRVHFRLVVVDSVQKSWIRLSQTHSLNNDFYIAGSSMDFYMDDIMVAEAQPII